MHVHMTGIIWPGGGGNVSLSKRREGGREKAGTVKHSGFRNAVPHRCLCTQAVQCSALLICKYSIFQQQDPESKSLVAHLFKLLKLLFRAVILLHFHFLVPNQNPHWFPFQQPCLVHQIAPLFLHLHPSFPREKNKTEMFEPLSVTPFLLQANGRRSGPIPLTSESLSAIISSSEPSSSEESAKRKQPLSLGNRL